MRKVIDAEEDWRDDEDLVEEHNALVLRVETAQLGWETAQRDTASDITALFDGPEFVTADEMDGDGHDGNEIPYGFSEIPEDMPMPWGGATDVNQPWHVDAWNAAGDIATGAAQDFSGLTGLWHDGNWANPFFGAQGQENRTSYMSENLEGLSLLTGFYDPTEPEGDQWGVDSFGEWVDNFLPPLREVGQGIVPTDEWEDRPGYVITQGTINIGLIAGGVALSLTGAGAVVGAPMAALGMRNGISALNDVGTGHYDVPDFRTPGVDVSRLPGTPSSGAVPTTGVGAWFSDLLGDLQNSVGRVGQGQGPSDPTIPPPRGPGSGDGAGDGSGRGSGRHPDEPDTGATPADVERLIDGVEEHVRHNAENPDAELQVLNSRLGQEVFGDQRVPEPAGAGSTVLRSDHEITDSAGDLGGGNSNGNSSVGGGESRSGDIGASGSRSESGGPTSGSGPGNPGGTGPVISGGGTSSTGGDLGPPPGGGRGGEGSGDAPGAPVHIGPGDPLMPGLRERFGDGIDLDPDRSYEITDSAGRSSTYFTDSSGKINEIHTDARLRGPRHPELVNPHTDAKYVVRSAGTEYTYYTDSHGRTVRAEGELVDAKHKRFNGIEGEINKEPNQYFGELNRRIEEEFRDSHGRDPRPGEVDFWDTSRQWNGGHIYGASEFAGPGEHLNQVAMLDDVNQARTHTREKGIYGSYRKVEMTWSALLRGEEHKLRNHLGDKYESVMSLLQPALDAGPRPPKIETTIDMIDHPNLKPVTLGNGEVVHPPPASIEVNWTVNGVPQDPIEYINLPKGPNP